ncbi:MAG: PIG-L family deacetylase [Lentisphaeria bacterium]
MNKSVLVIAAHLDDSIIAVGGILSKFVKNGYRVNVVCFGNGDEGFTTPDGRERAIIKFKSEGVEAHKLLGVSNFECFDVPDFGVHKNRDDYRQCIRSIRKYKPAIIIGHYWAEYFQHHEMASQARDAWFQAGWNCSADLGEPWTADKYYHYEVLQDLPEPTHLVDISDTFEDKIESFKRFTTAEEHLGSLAEQLRARARYHGSKIGVKYAEALKQSFFTPQKIAEIKDLF